MFLRRASQVTAIRSPGLPSHGESFEDPVNPEKERKKAANLAHFSEHKRFTYKDGYPAKGFRDGRSRSVRSCPEGRDVKHWSHGSTQRIIRCNNNTRFSNIS